MAEDAGFLSLQTMTNQPVWRREKISYHSYLGKTPPNHREHYHCVVSNLQNTIMKRNIKEN